MMKLDDMLQGVRTVAVAGHVNPDGDCIGSVMGIWLYLRDNYPQIHAETYLETYRDVFSYIEGLEQAKSTCDSKHVPDLMILTDISSRSRIGVAGKLAEMAPRTLCFDHHVTNRDSYTWVDNRPDASSACEVVYEHLDPEKISCACAAALYTGIIHDTGMFQYSCTSPRTMRVAAELMEKGIPFSSIADASFFQKNYGQNQVTGKVLLESRLLFDGRMILGSVGRTDMQIFGLESKDMDGIVSVLRNTAGTEAAVFLYELEEGVWKVSMRSREWLDVSRIAQQFGGGGHMRAAGCNIEGKEADVAETVIRAFEGFFSERA